jgi:hypothetical protein
MGLNIDDIVFTNKDIKALREWLKLEDKAKVDCCPFKRFNRSRNHYCENICGRIYVLDRQQCPCKVYGIKEVIKNTKHVVRNNPTLGDRFKRWSNGISM